jgi:hypothetical protein
LARFFVKVVEMLPAKKTARIVLPEGSKDDRPGEQNFAVLKRSKGGGLLTVPIGDRVLKPGQKYQIRTTADGKVFLQNR